MILGIDGFEANVSQRVGIGQYAYHLLKQMEVQSDSLKFKIYLKNWPPREDMPHDNEWWEYKKLPQLPFSTQFALPLTLFTEKDKCDVFWSPTHYAPRFSPCPVVLSIMDLSYLYFPESFRKRDLWQLRSWGGYSIKKAAKILTISESTKKDLVNEYKVNPANVIVTYPGYDKENFRITNYELRIKQLKKYNITGEYVLYNGTLQPRKNLIRLIEAFNNIRIDSNTQLVIAGKKGWLYSDIFKKVKELGLESEVIFTDFIPDDDLAALMAGATVFVLPSLYEGFGLPVVEAMAVGTPVAVANVSSLPEVVGDAGVMFDPYSVDDMTSKLLRLLKEPRLREEMREKGLARVKMFSWEKCAKKTLEVLEHANNY